MKPSRTSRFSIKNVSRERYDALGNFLERSSEGSEPILTNEQDYENRLMQSAVYHFSGATVRVDYTRYGGREHGDLIGAVCCESPEHLAERLKSFVGDKRKWGRWVKNKNG